MKSKYYILFILITCILVVLNACKKNGDKEDQIDYVISPNALNIPGEVYENAIVQIDTTGTFTFSNDEQQISAIKTGDILVSPPISMAPNGFLKEVISVSSAGSTIIVTTKDATLEDVFTQLNLDYTRELTVNDLDGQPLLLKGVVSKPDKIRGEGFYLEIDQTLFEDGAFTIEANGTIEINPYFVLNIKIKDMKLEEALFKAGISETAELEVRVVGQVSANPELIIAQYHFTPLLIWVGWVPLVITPVMEIQLGVDASVSAGLVSSVTQSVTLEGGLQYIDGSWNKIATFDKSFEFTPPELTAGLEAKGYAGPQIDLLLYGIAGPYADLNGYLDIEADVFNTPWWELYGGAELGMGVQVRMLGKQIVDYYIPAVIGYRVLLAQAESGTEGQINGIVKDALTEGPLQNVVVDIFKESVNVASTITTIDGNFSASIPAGQNYRITFTKSGYIQVTYNNVEVAAFVDTYLEPIMQIDENYSGIGSISGYINDAFNGSGVYNLTLSLREGVNTTSGTVLFTSNTDYNGGYSFTDISAGNYTIEANGSGYMPSFFTVFSIGGQNTPNQNGTITPILNENEIRIILTWGLYPYDLDSHLTGPIPESSDRFHVFFSDEYYYYVDELYANLDVDDVTSYGPETVTIYHQTNGLYRYSVHDFTNRLSTYSLDLANSGAQVRLYRGSELLHAFNVPANAEGTLWTVFEMVDNNIMPINTMSYESDPSVITKSSGNSTDAYLLLDLPSK